VLARSVKTVPDATDAVVNAGGALAPKKFNVQVPACPPVPKGSAQAFEIARPVSNPAWFVTKGKSNTVLHMLIFIAFLDVDVSMNLGIGPPPDGHSLIKTEDVGAKVPCVAV